jgi:hypothetical protein
MLPLMSGLLVTSIVSGQLISRTGRYRIFPILGGAVATAGLLLLSRLDVGTGRVESSIYLFVFGSGVGMMMQTLILAVQNAASRSLMGVATSGVTFFRSMGSSFGVAIFGAIFANRLDYYVIKNVPADQLQALGNPSGSDLGQSREIINALPALVRSGVIESFMDALHVAFLAAVPVALGTFILAWWLREIPLRTTVHDEAEGGAPGEEAHVLSVAEF